MTISEIVAIRLREIFYAKGLSLYKVCELCGMSSATLSCVVYNRYNSVNLKTIFIILQSLNISVLEFFDSPLFANLNTINLD